MANLKLDEAVAAARGRSELADDVWQRAKLDLEVGPPERKAALQVALAEAAAQRKDAGIALADALSKRVADELLTRYAEDHAAALHQGKAIEQAQEVADLNLYLSLTGTEHLGERAELPSDVAWELTRFGQHHVDAYHQLADAPGSREDSTHEHPAEQGIEPGH